MKNTVSRLLSKRRCRLICLPSITSALLVAGVGAQAQTVFYDNTSPATNYGVGTANNYGGVFSGNTVTAVMADDITISGSQNVNITSFSVEARNFGAIPIRARPIISIYMAYPGSVYISTFLKSFTLPLTTFAGRSNQLINYDPGIGSLFTAPANHPFWAGISFDNNFGAGSAPNLLANMGQLVHDPPTVGSSADLYFQADSAVASGGIPTGTYNYYGHSTDPGKPNANFGWKFSGTAAVPEPGAIAAFAVGISALPLLRRRAVKK